MAQQSRREMSKRQAHENASSGASSDSGPQLEPGGVSQAKQTYASGIVGQMNEVMLACVAGWTGRAHSCSSRKDPSCDAKQLLHQ